MAVASKFIVAFIKNRWREIIIVILTIISYFALSRKPEIQEITKLEYVDRIVEKEVIVEKIVVKDKKKRTTIKKPDGTKITTEIIESTKTDEKSIVAETEKEEKEIRSETKIQTNHSYSLGINVKLYPEIEYSAGLYMRLGGLPLLIGPNIYVNTTKSVQVGIGLGLQIEI